MRTTAYRLLPALLLCGAALAPIQDTRASIIWSGVQDVSLPDTFDGIYFDFTDLNDAAVFTTATSEPAAWDLNFAFGGAIIANSSTLSPVRVTDAVNSTVLNLAAGTTVDAGSTIYTGGTGESVSSDHIGTGGLPDFNNGVQGYLGFLIEFGGLQYPGWALVTIYDNNNTGTLHSWAWESTAITAGGSIEVGAIPEASEALVVMCGLTGLLAGTRRRTRRPVPRA